MGRAAHMVGLIARLLRDRRGGVAVMSAAILPALCLIGAGGIDLANVYSARGAMQDAADAVALTLAKQVGVSSASAITSRADSLVRAELTSLTNVTLNVTATVAADNSTVTVDVTGNRASFFGNLLPPGGWNMSAEAVAKPSGQIPLCVLQSGGNILQLQNSSQMTATNCLVQSDGSMAVDPDSVLRSGLAEAVGSATGPITPTAQSGAAAIADPFASMNIQPVGICQTLDVVYDLGINILAPGVHCGNIVVQKNAIVQLLPGEHYFIKGHLQLKENSTLQGTDVALIFDNSTQIQFQDQSVVDLSGRQSGPYAGFVMATTTQNVGNFDISSSNAYRLLGTLYLPNATLRVSGNGNSVAQQSAWTVVIAKGIQMSGSANLVINTAYASSPVPVPMGVGNNLGVMLVK